MRQILPLPALLMPPKLCTPGFISYYRTDATILSETVLTNLMKKHSRGSQCSSKERLEGGGGSTTHNQGEKMQTYEKARSS